jgi:hypothetical protein
MENKNICFQWEDSNNISNYTFQGIRVPNNSSFLMERNQRRVSTSLWRTSCKLERPRRKMIGISPNFEINVLDLNTFTIVIQLIFP